MDSSLLIGLEMAGVLGLALAWGGYELWTLRKWRERERQERDRERDLRAGRDVAGEPSDGRDPP